MPDDRQHDTELLTFAHCFWRPDNGKLQEGESFTVMIAHAQWALYRFFDAPKCVAVRVVDSTGQTSKIIKLTKQFRQWLNNEVVGTPLPSAQR